MSLNIKQLPPSLAIAIARDGRHLARREGPKDVFLLCQAWALGAVERGTESPISVFDTYPFNLFYLSARFGRLGAKAQSADESDSVDEAVEFLALAEESC